MNRIEHTLDLGAAELFPLAREAILSWELHESAGVLARPLRRIEVGHLVDLRLNPMWPRPPRCLRGEELTIPVGACQIAEVVDDEDRAGFTYRTQPGHLVSGDETFLVSVGADGRLGVTISSTSMPGHPLLRAVAPLSVTGQKLMARRYAHGLRQALKGASAG